jgi:hypothetical protein
MAVTTGAPTIHRTNVPYFPSWIDRLTAWIDHLPIPIWLFYTLIFLGIALLINIIFWVDGGLQFGTFDPFNSSFAIWVVYWLGLYQYLTRVGTRVLRDFRPLMDVDDSEFTRIDLEFATLPRKLGWLTVPLGFGFAIANIIGEPEPYGDYVIQSSLPIIFDIIISGFMISVFYALLIRSIRQLRLVNKLHKRVVHINLLDLNPTHAFSNLTARTGAGLILVLIFGYLQDPLAAITKLDIFFYVTTALLAAAIFIVPLTGMQEQLRKEKERKLRETNDLLQIATEYLHTKVKSGDYAELGGTKDAITALLSERDLLKKTSTWPWDPKTIRGFGSTLLLPILLWVVTRLLERFI